MPVKMILQDGPLDGEQQLVENLNTTPGYEMQFNIPNFQTFDEAGDNVVGLGLVAVYSYVGPGPAPGGGDSWTASMIYEFTGEFFIPQPSPIPPQPPIELPPAVFMNALSTLVVNANDPSAGVQLLGETVMEVDAFSTSIGWGSVVLIGETTMVIFRQPWANTVAMTASSAMSIAGVNTPPINILSAEDSGFEGGTIGDWTHYQFCSVANSSAQAHSGIHSMAVTCDGTGTQPTAFIGYPTPIPVVAGHVYQFAIWFLTPTAARPAHLYAWWINSGGSLVSQSAVQVTTTVGAWTFLTMAAQAPVGAVSVQLLPWIDNAANGEVFYIDDISIGEAN